MIFGQNLICESVRIYAVLASFSSWYVQRYSIVYGSVCIYSFSENLEVTCQSNSSSTGHSFQVSDWEIVILGRFW